MDKAGGIIADMKYDRDDIISTANALIRKMNACGDWQLIDEVIYAVTNRQEMHIQQ